MYEKGVLHVWKGQSCMCWRGVLHVWKRSPACVEGRSCMCGKGSPACVEGESCMFRRGVLHVHVWKGNPACVEGGVLHVWKGSPACVEGKYVWQPFLVVGQFHCSGREEREISYGPARQPHNHRNKEKKEWKLVCCNRGYKLQDDIFMCMFLHLSMLNSLKLCQFLKNSAPISS